MKNLEQLKKMKEEAIALMKSKGQEMLGPEFMDFFAANHEVSAIAWVQYTPYWNDGEACEFSIRGMYALLEKPTKKALEAFSGYEENDGYVWVGPYVDNLDEIYGLDERNINVNVEPDRVKEIVKNLKTFEKAISDNELFQLAFGDHVKVIAKPGAEFIVEEYQHD